MLIKAKKSDKIISFLRREFLVNENIIGVIENLPSAEIFVDNVDNPTGVLVKKDGYMHYVYTDNEAFLDNICENYFVEGFFGFSGVEGKLAEKIRSRYLIGWESRCTLYYMPKENLDLSLKKNPTQPIKLEDAELVDHFYQYRGPETLEVIKRDITKRPSSAVYVDDEIACWVLIHDDNSMGIMYTKEEHRRKGYAVDVTTDLAHQIIEAGKIPFIQIVKGNSMSPGLAEKCGFIEAGKADWFGIIAGSPKEIADANDRSRKEFLNSLPEWLHNVIYGQSRTYKGLYNYLHSFKYDTNKDEGLRLVKAESEEQKQAWCHITSQNIDSSIGETAVEEALMKLAENSNFNLYVMYRDDIAVAASTTHKFDEEDRGLYLLSVLPKYKNSDLLKGLINETAQAEKNSGCYFMVAQAEERHVDILKELYFRESHTIKIL